MRAVAGFLLHSCAAVCRTCAGKPNAAFGGFASIVPSQGASAILCARCGNPLLATPVSLERARE